jgi:hypothetical protein
MVYALREAWRVLVPHGVMVDVRPLSVDVPLEIVYKGGCESAGMIDMSPEIHLDIAADDAIDTVSREGIFRETHKELFDFAFYWKTVKGMQEDLEENWKDELFIDKDVWKRAKKIIKQKHSQTQLRIAMKMKLAIYQKLETPESVRL